MMLMKRRDEFKRSERDHLLRMAAIAWALATVVALSPTICRTLAKQSSLESLPWLALVVTILAWGSALWSYNRHHDLFAPDVAFTLIYWYWGTAGAIHQLFFSDASKYPRVEIVDVGRLPLAMAGVLLGLVGLRIGLAFPLRQPVRRQEVVPEISSERAALLKRYLKLGLLGGCTLYWTGIAVHGVSRYFTESYGSTFYQYGLDYYIILVGGALFSSAFLFYVLMLARDGRRVDAILLLCAVLFLGPHLIRGGRQALFRLGLGFLLINYYYGKRLKWRQITAIILGLALVGFIVGLSRGLRQGYPPVLRLVQNFSPVTIIYLFFLPGMAVDGVFTQITNLVPSLTDWQMGSTYVAAFVNLVPGFVFGSNLTRPLLTPALAFRALHYPDVTKHGYDFTIWAEAYWNFGWIGVFLVFLVLGVLCRWTYSRMQSSRRVLPTLVYTFIFVGLAWSLRSDSNFFVKWVVHSLVVVFGLWKLSLVTISPAQKPENEAVRAPGSLTLSR